MGQDTAKIPPTIEENVLHRAVLHAINQVLENKGDFVQTFRKNVVTALTHGTEDSEYAKEKKKLQKSNGRADTAASPAETAIKPPLRNAVRRSQHR
ncbi:MAG: hypothetical protein ACLTW9_29645 [Enterocloster sp.]